jgi:hypothetical protein
MYRVDINDSVTSVTPTGIYTRWFESAAQAGLWVTKDQNLSAQWNKASERELSFVGSEISHEDVAARLGVPPDLFPSAVLVKALNDLELKKEHDCWARENARIAAEQQQQRDAEAKRLAAQLAKERATAIADMVEGGMTPEAAAAQYDEDPF